MKLLSASFLTKALLITAWLGLFIVTVTLGVGKISPVEAQSPAHPDLIEGRIVDIPDTKVRQYPDGTQTVIQNIEIELDDQRTARVEIERLEEDTNFAYQEGDRVVVSKISGQDGEDQYFLSDFVRRPALFLLFGLFVALVLSVSRGHGVRALLGLVSSFVIIFNFILPYIEQGYDPIIIAIIGALFIILISFYLTHGFSAKTTVAVMGTFIALVATGALASIFSDLAYLTGFATEEAAFLQVMKGEVLNIRGLMMAGIIIGALGVLDDITISQASIVRELIRANPKLSKIELFRRAMNVGRDHIASLVNTLVLVYTGSALPLLLLFFDNNLNLMQIINFEIIAEEIVRTLVGSIGLVLAVPITTLVAVYWRELRQEALSSEAAELTHSHHHH